MPCTNKDCGLIERLAANQTLAEAELAFRRLVIMRAVRQTRGNQSAAADLLDIHRNTILRIMAECQIEDEWVDRVKANAALHGRPLHRAQRERDPELTAKEAAKCLEHQERR